MQRLAKTWKLCWAEISLGISDTPIAPLLGPQNDTKQNRFLNPCTCLWGHGSHLAAWMDSNSGVEIRQQRHTEQGIFTNSQRSQECKFRAYWLQIPNICGGIKQNNFQNLYFYNIIYAYIHIYTHTCTYTKSSNEKLHLHIHTY